MIVHGRVLVLRVPSIVLTYVGAIAVWCGFRVALGVPDLLGIGQAVGLTEPIPAALALAAGALELAAGLRLSLLRLDQDGYTLPKVTLVGRVLLVSVVLIALFWATSAYSQRAGETLAAHINAAPTRQAEVTVRSEEPLGLWSATPPIPTPGPSTPDISRYQFLRVLPGAQVRALPGRRPASG